MANFGFIRASFTVYIGKVIKNAAINYKLKVTNISKSEILLDDAINLQSDFDGEIVDSLVEDVAYSDIHKVFTNPKYSAAMRQLDDREKLVLYLYALEGLSIKEIANVLKVSENNVKVIKYRAKNKFLNYIRKDEK